MNRNHIRAYLLDSKKLKKVYMKILVIMILIICDCSFCYFYYLKNKKIYINYSENGNLNYKVYLKENEFFNQEFVEANKEYVTNLINYIYADFDYNLNLAESNVEYSYSYRTEAVVDIHRKDNNNVLYDYTENITPEEIQTTTEQQIQMKKFETIDYNKYNEIAKSFISLYDLDNVGATLTINFYVNVSGNSDKFESDVESDNVYTLCIPLNENTINVDVKNNYKDETDNVIECKKTDTGTDFIVFIICALCIIILGKIYSLVKYIQKNRTAESIYEKQLRKILNNYGSYIQKVNNEFNAEGKSVLEVDTFYDLLEIRETIQEPIIMLKDESKKETYFMIMGRMDVVYIYNIRVSDIKVRKSRVLNIK